MAKELKEKKLATEVRAILKEEKEHLKLCTQLAKENSTRS
jgi:demethoxyubiquinone hydroxylase (CLK1/Coq7/Cat5 family)